MIKKFLFVLSISVVFISSVVAYASTGASLDVALYNDWINSNYNKFNVPYQIDKGSASINGVTGQMTTTELDYSLPGKNGMDLNIYREHNNMKDIVRSQEKNNSTGNFILARYILPSGEYKYVRFFTAEEYHENGENGIYVNSSHTNINTENYSSITTGAEYLVRDTTYEPRIAKYDTSYRVYDFYIMDIPETQLKLGYDWYIATPCSKPVVAIYATGLANYYRRCSSFRLSNGCLLIASEYFRISRNVVSEYNVTFEGTNEYEMLTPHENMRDEEIVDTQKGITYFYSIKHKDGHIWYYNSSGQFVAEEDKYGNIIKYEYSNGNIIITDTMGRIVTLDGTNKKITLTCDGVSEDVVYYEVAEINDREDDFSDYYSSFVLKVKKPNNEETQTQCANTTEYHMKYRHNMYYSIQVPCPYILPLYIIDKIVYPDGTNTVYEYSKIEIENEISWPIYEYMLAKQYDINNGCTSNVLNYTYTYNYNASDSYVDFSITREDGYIVTKRYNINPAKIKWETIVGDGINKRYDYEYSGQLITKEYITSYDDNDGAFEFSFYGYDNRDNCIYADNMGKKVWYDYGTKETNPYNILLSQQFENNGQMQKTENTLTTDLKGISDTKNYVEEDGEFVLKSHISYTYDQYGNISKITERPDLTTEIETHISYTYDLPEYSVETYVEDIEAYDGMSEDISTLKEYDKYGRLFSETDGNGNTTFYVYDKLNRLTSVINPDNTTQTYTYDVTENSVIAINENGTKIKQIYDVYGKPLALYAFHPTIEQYVKLQEYTYNANDGQVSSIMNLGPENKELITYYEYDDADRVKNKVIKQKQNSGTEIIVDEQNYSYTIPKGTGTYLKAVDDTSEETKPTYEMYSGYKQFILDGQYDYLVFDSTATGSDFRVVYEDDDGTRTTLAQYSSRVNQTYVADVQGLSDIYLGVGNDNTHLEISNIIGYTAEDLKNLRSTTTTEITGDSSIAPPIIQQDFDLWGNMVGQRQVEASDTTNVFTEEVWTYDALGNNLTYKNPVSVNQGIDTEVKTYDYAGNVLTQTVKDSDQGDFVTTNTYDLMGRLLTSYNGKTTYTYEYDKLGRVISESNYTNGGVRYKYDKNGNVIRKQEATQSTANNATPTYNTTDYEYDNRNRLVKVIQYASGTTNPEYTQYYYDGVGNVLRMYTGLTSPLTINGLDNVIAGSDAKYNVIKYEYNFLNQLVKETDSFEKSETMTYDYMGNLLTKMYKDDSMIVYLYDWRGNVTNVYTSNNETISYTYDKFGNRVSMTDSTGTTTYSYNNLSQLVTETKGNVVKNYTYDANGNRTRFTLNVDTVTPVDIIYSKSNTGMLSSITSGNDQVTYGYDVAGNVKDEIINDDVEISYVYLPMGYLLRVNSYITNNGNLYHSTNPYLVNGNIKSNATLYSDMVITTNYTYDGLGRLVSEQATNGLVSNTYTYDEGGNRISIVNEKTYSYDYDNVLKMITIDDGYSYISSNYNGQFVSMYTSVTNGESNDKVYSYNSFGGLIKIETHLPTANTYTYEYDGDGRRTAKVVNGVRTDFVWDGDYIVAEITGGEITSYIRGTKLHMRKQGTDTDYYLYNTHGDVTQLINTDGTIIEEYKYDAFGNQLNETTDQNPFRYCGEYYDAETGLIYLRARYYDTDIGRFISEDPIRDGLNWYVYCGNNPVNFVDPSGLDSYILYDPNMPSGDGLHMTKDEAEIRKKELENKYGTTVHLIGVSDATAFKDVWNSKVGYDINGNEVQIDEIVIILHGSVEGSKGNGVGFMYFQDGSRIAARVEAIRNSKDIDIFDLDWKNMKNLYLSVCNSGNPDVYNVAYRFQQGFSISDSIVAWDGGTIYNYSNNELEAGAYDGWYKEPIRQHTYYKHVDKYLNGKPKRDRIGKRIIPGIVW